MYLFMDRNPIVINEAPHDIEQNVLNDRHIKIFESISFARMIKSTLAVIKFNFKIRSSV